MVGIESEVVEVRELDDNVSNDVMNGLRLTSSSDLTSSGCLFAMCFSTKDVALNSFWQVLQRNLPSSSCFMYGSATFDNSLDRK
jgi:hypothetical protein